jgi:hypothetical protein
LGSFDVTEGKTKKPSKARIMEDKKRKAELDNVLARLRALQIAE